MHVELHRPLPTSVKGSLSGKDLLGLSRLLCAGLGLSVPPPVVFCPPLGFVALPAVCWGCRSGLGLLRGFLRGLSGLSWSLFAVRWGLVGSLVRLRGWFWSLGWLVPVGLGCG